jgi:hypothetical protein
MGMFSFVAVKAMRRLLLPILSLPVDALNQRQYVLAVLGPIVVQQAS